MPHGYTDDSHLMATENPSGLLVKLEAFTKGLA